MIILTGILWDWSPSKAELTNLLTEGTGAADCCIAERAFLNNKIENRIAFHNQFSGVGKFYCFLDNFLFLLDIASFHPQTQ